MADKKRIAPQLKSGVGKFKPKPSTELSMIRSKSKNKK